VTGVSSSTGVSSDSATVTTTYDAVGRVLQALRTTSEDAMWLRNTHTYSSITGCRRRRRPTEVRRRAMRTTGATEWFHDGLGRVVSIENRSARDSVVYDAASNIVARYRGSAGAYGDTVTMVYDAMNRLVAQATKGKSYDATTRNNPEFSWTFPYYASSGLTSDPDTSTYTYDAMGNLLTANNQYAHITRTYYANGLLETERQALKEYGSSSFTNHVYDLEFAYDL
jgi:YD repeat-containing protein